MTAPPLWTVDAMAQAMRAGRAGPLPQSVSGLSIDTRTITLGVMQQIVRAVTDRGVDVVRQ